VRYLLPAFLAWAIAQVTKLALTSIRERRLNLRVLAETGGMPSSHAAIVMGLTAAVGRVDGVSSATFAIALIFSFVVMYDAQAQRTFPAAVRYSPECATCGTDGVTGLADLAPLQAAYQAAPTARPAFARASLS